MERELGIASLDYMECEDLIFNGEEAHSSSNIHTICKNMKMMKEINIYIGSYVGSSMY